jgi:hypothetical protein
MNANVKSTRGRKPLKVKFPTGAFTVDQLFAMNDKAKGGSVKCELTARNHIKRGLATGKLVKLADKLNTGKVGAPAFKFQLASYAKHNEARRAKKALAPAIETPEAPEVSKTEQVQ